MKTIKRSALVARRPALLYALVNDIDSYPGFVPGCTAARIVERRPDEIIARLEVRRGLLHTHFTTRNRLQPEHAVHMQLVEGPFKQLAGEWRFTPVGDEGCRIDFELRFEFSNPLKAALFEPLFEQTLGELLRAFVARAQQLPAAPA